MPCFFFLGIQNSKIFLCTVEMQPANRLAIVVIKQDAEIALSITVDDTCRIYDGAHNRFDDKESFQLLRGSLNTWLLAVGLIVFLLLIFRR